jgi:hypothetical protein
MCGRGMHEKVIGELEGNVAFGTVPTHHYGANSAWHADRRAHSQPDRQLPDRAGAPRRVRSRKYTALFPLQSAQTPRFELFHPAGEVVHPNGTTILRLPDNAHVRRRFEAIAARLARAA